MKFIVFKPTRPAVTRFTIAALLLLALAACNVAGDSTKNRFIIFKPIDLVAIGVYQGVDLSWDAVAGANSYSVYYHTDRFDSTGEDGVKSQKGIAATSTSIGGLTNGTTYHLRVEAINADGSILSTSRIVSATANLQAPPNVIATGRDKTVYISWGKVKGATSYSVYYSKASFDKTTDGGVKSQTGITANFTSIKGLTSGTTYYFRVIASNPSASSAMSKIQSSFTKLAPHPSAATSISLAAVDLSWDAIAGVTNYKIYYAKQSLDGLPGGYQKYATVGGKVDTVDDTSRTIGNLSADTTYYFVVAANYNGEEVAAPEVSARSSYIAELAVGGIHSCVRLNTGRIKCWGYNYNGQLGVDDTKDRNTATSVPGSLRAKQLSAGYWHSCAIDLVGKLYCWGSNYSSQLGLSGDYISSPTLVTQFAKVSLVSAGAFSSCVVADGNNYCWGSQYRGMLGNGVNGEHVDITMDAQRINDITPDVKQFALGDESGCAIDASNDLWCWGWNRNGQVGNGKSGYNEMEPSPVKPKLKGSSKATTVDGKSHHFCAVDDDTKVQCWGWNKYGQLGINSDIDSNTPQYVLASASVRLAGVSKIATGYYHSCALIKSGKVRCWGDSDDGKIGDATTDRLVADTDMPDITNAIDIAAGWDHTCVLLKGRARVRCWGVNEHGQLGNGRSGWGGWSAWSHTPVAVKGLTPPIRIPAAPTKLKATGGYKIVDISWDAVTVATSYKVYYHTDKDVSPSPGKNLGSKLVTGNSTTITRLTNGTKYYFIVLAYNKNVGSRASSVVTATPSLRSPTWLRAFGSYKSVDLSWDRVPGVDGYRVYYHTANDVSPSLGKNLGSKAVIGDSSTSMTISGLNSGIIYYFTVFAYKNNVNSKASSVVTATTNLRRPTGLQASSSDYQSVALSWHRGPRVDGYVVYYHTSNNVSPDNNLGSKVVTGNYTTITDLTNGQPYHFVVVAYIGSVQSLPSSAATATPNLSQPTNLNATGVYQGIDLSWEEAKGATSYTVYYHTVGFNKTTDSGVKSQTGLTATNNRITGLLSGTEYFIRLVASNTRGDSELSDEASAITKLAAQTKLRATGKIKAIDLSWGDVAGASYSIYYHTASFGSTTDSGVKSKTGITATNTRITGLTDGTKYYLRVAVIKDGGDKKLSEEASVFTKSLALQPLAAASISSLAAVDLAWKAVAGVTNYKIYYAKQSLDKLKGGYQRYASVGGKFDTTEDTRTTIGDLSADTTYYFVVTANYKGGESAALEVTADSSYIAELAMGSGHSCVRSNTGSIKCWGYNRYGQLGVGDNKDRNTATSVDLRVKQLSAGYEHSCAIDLNDKLYCWGWNEYYQLGVHNWKKPYRSSPTWVDQDDLTSVSLVGAAGYRSTCAVAGGKNYCWGSEVKGALGNGYSSGSIMTANEINNIAPAVVKQFALGKYSGCAIDASKVLWCWGNNEYGQVGVGSSDRTYTSPVKPKLKGSAKATMLSGIHEHYCVVDDTNKIQCWGGENFSGQLGIGSTTTSNSPQYVRASERHNNPLRNVSKIAVGSYHSCALLIKGGKVRCWGESYGGRIGPVTVFTRYGTYKRLVADTDMPEINNAIDIAAGGGHTCVLLKDRARVKCWGFNGAGQLGNGSTGGSSDTPVEVQGLTDITAPPPGSIPAPPTKLQATGKNKAIDLSWRAVKGATSYTVYYYTASFSSPTDDRVKSQTVTAANTSITGLTAYTTYYFGVIASNVRGNSAMSQIQSATTKLPAPRSSAAASISSPLAVDLTWDALAGVTDYKIYYAKQSLDGLPGGYKKYKTAKGKFVTATGTSRTIGNLSIDTIYYFVVTSNHNGEEAAAPEVYAKPSYIAELAVGGSHSCVRLNTGSIKCWGSNASGQLGLGDTDPRYTATSVPILRAKQLSVGTGYSCANLNHSIYGLYCWGSNYHSKLGLSADIHHSIIPTWVQHDLAWVSLVTTGYTSTCAVADGKNYCWGSQASGGLGDGVAKYDSTMDAQEIRDITPDVKQFALGRRSGCAIDASDDLWCWGNNKYGQVGDGTTTNQPSPFKLTLQGDSKATMVDAGENHYCVVDNAKEIQCWGKNDYGQLGMGSKTSYSNSPQYVLASKRKSDHLSNVSKIAIRGYRGCALITGGKVRCWGQFFLIDSDFSADSLIADTDVPDINNAIDIASGYAHTCVLLKDKASVKCWGWNISGKRRYTPVAVKGLTPSSWPAKPTNLQATGKNSAIDLSWDAATEATSYKVYYHTASFSSAFDSGVQVKTGITTTNTSIAGLNGTKYYLRVEAINAEGDTNLSAEVSATAAFQAPGIAAGRGFNKGIVLLLGKQEGSIGYIVYYSTAKIDKTSDGGMKSKTLPASVPSAAFTGLTNGITYYFRAVAKYPEGNSGLSNQVSGTANLRAPTNVIAIGKNKAIDLSWGVVTGATGYKVYYSKARFSGTPASGVQIQTVPGRTTNTSIAGLDNGTKYYLRVDVINADGDTKPSTRVSTFTNLDTPTKLKATGRDKIVDISWSAVTGATGYKVYYHTASFDKTTVSVAKNQTVSAPTTNTSIANLTAGKTYYLRVEVINAKGDKKLSEEVTATTKSLLAYPSVSAASSISLAAVDLTWNAVTGVTDYKIYYAKQSLDKLTGGYLNFASVGGKVESTTDTSVTIGDLSIDTTYYFVVASNYKGGEAAAPEVEAKSSYIAELAMGGAHGCVRLNSGSIKCWGNNDKGQLGLGNTDPRYTATSVPNFRAKQLSAGDNHSCAIDLSDKLYCWGSNGLLKLGLSDSGSISSPTATQDNLAKVSLVSAGSHTTCAQADGENYCWGSQYLGALGNGFSNFASIMDAQEINSITPAVVQQFAVGNFSGCAIDASNLLWCWGFNKFGQVGNGTHGQGNDQPSPVNPSLQGGSKAAMLAGGIKHYCVVDKANKAQCWGRNGSGQLGIGSTTDSNTPQYVLKSTKPDVNLSDVSKIATGDSHSCALIAGGSVRCWGLGTNGRIGTADGAGRIIAETDMKGINNPAIDIAAGADFTCVLLADKASVECWGRNDKWQLGIGSIRRYGSYRPVAVKDLLK